MTTQSNEAMVLPEFSLNEQNINELYLEYKRKVYSLALSYVKDNYLAEDLTHEILVKCYLTHSKFKGNCSFYSWVYRIATNHCIDFLRKASRHQDLLMEDVEQFNTKFIRTPETELFKAHDQEELRNNIRKLPPKYEEILMLYYFKDQSLTEIEHHLKIKHSTIRTRLFRAKRMLREMY